MSIDRGRVLAEYADDRGLHARQSIYRYGTGPGFIEWALSHIEWEAARLVVDAGCGNGAYLRRLADRAVGIDLSIGMLRGLPPALHRVAGDVMHLPIASGRADAALAMH